MFQVFRLSRNFQNLNLFKRNCFTSFKYSLYHTTPDLLKTKEEIELAKQQEEIIEKLETESKEDNQLPPLNFISANIHDYKAVVDLKSKTLTPLNESKDTESFIKDDPDTFGTLTHKSRTQLEVSQMPHEEDDEVEVLINEKGKVREHNLEYAKKISKLVKEKKLIEALKVLEIEMKDVKARPANYIFTILIGECGRQGFTEKAFKLYSQMRKRKLKVTAATYTALINACATCHSSKRGLRHLHKLRLQMTEHHYEPNLANYNAMIKAYGHHGKLQLAFTVVDEMLASGVLPDLATFHFLMQACISDKDAGFRHALLVWHKMRSKRVSPDVMTFNLMLRAARECHLGDEEATKEVIASLLPPEKRLELESHQNQAPQIANEDCKVMSFEESISEELPDLPSQPVEPVENRPNLLALVPHLGSIVSIGEIKTPEDRLLLLGGATGFLKQMKNDLAKPSIKTFTLLLECVPNSINAERDILQLAKQHNIRLDTGFCNMLIKRRCFRFDYVKARDVLQLFQEYVLMPDLITYGCLALSCETMEQAEKFVENLTKHGYRLNKQMLAALLTKACANVDIPFIEMVLDLFLEYDVQPDEKIIKNLDKFIQKIKQRLQNKANGTFCNDTPVVNEPWFNKVFYVFLNTKHKKWVKSIQVEKVEPYENQIKYEKQSKTSTER